MKDLPISLDHVFSVPAGARGCVCVCVFFSGGGTGPTSLTPHDQQVHHSTLTWIVLVGGPMRPPRQVGKPPLSQHKRPCSQWPFAAQDDLNRCLE